MATAPDVPSTSATTYDETPYPASSHPQTHPNRLAAMARIFGLAASAPSRARVLELGCADGSNLLPMAEQYPTAQFLGIDSSQVQIREGKKAVSAAGLKNVELRHQNILEFPASEGPFDYIIVHGLFSLVTGDVRKKILTICQTQLAAQGVAYISYNAFPGWHMRRSLRDMMLYHTHAFADPKTKVQQGRALLAFLADSVPTENNAYGLMLKGELEEMRRQPDNFIRHDILEENNTPFYFHDFMALANQHGLQYLGETGLAEMLSSNFPEKVRDTLGQVASHIIQQEQYMDFLRNRGYRQTLLVRAGQEIRRSLTPDVAKALCFRSLLKQPEAAVDLTHGVPVSFVSLRGLSITTGDAFLKAALQSLAETGGTSAISFKDLLAISRLRSRPLLGQVGPDRDQVDEETLSANLLTMLTKAFVEPFAEPVVVDARVPEKPAASPLVRYQALNAHYITDRVHQPLPGDVLARYVIEFSDGTRTRDEIVGALVTYVKQDKLAIKEGDTKITDIVRLREIVGPRVDLILNRIAAAGFFTR
jgi:methyltransferase-like protein/ubiquinone/menaquinone biosynthesis C-methylase UbiE